MSSAEVARGLFLMTREPRSTIPSNVGLMLGPVVSWEEDEANPPHFTNALVRWNCFFGWMCLNGSIQGPGRAIQPSFSRACALYRWKRHSLEGSRRKSYTLFLRLLSSTSSTIRSVTPFHSCFSSCASRGGRRNGWRSAIPIPPGFFRSTSGTGIWRTVVAASEYLEGSSSSTQKYEKYVEGISSSWTIGKEGWYGNCG